MRQIQIQCRPLLSRWPKPETPIDWRRNGGFKVSADRMWYDLEYELDQIGARDVLLEFDMALASFRKLDTRPFADARANSPKVLLNCTLEEVGEIQYACDQYYAWQSNLRAISLTLSAQRSVLRYGAISIAEAYGGLKRLPPAGGTSEQRELTPEEAARALIEYDPSTPQNGDREGLTGVMLTIPSVARMIARNAVKATHPDTGGDVVSFGNVERARTVLSKHHGTDV